MKKFYTVIFYTLMALSVAFANFNIADAEEVDVESNSISLVFVGDILMHTPLINQGKIKDELYDYSFIFENVKDDIESADIAIVNQETIFIKDRDKYSSYPTFGSPIEVGEAEVDAGFDIIAHATNHTADKGEQGIKDTLSFWSNFPEIGVLGIHSKPGESPIYWKEVNGATISFLNYTYGLNGLEGTVPDYMVDLIPSNSDFTKVAIAKETSDIVVVILHIGEEYRYTPTNYQREIVEKCIDRGADVVFCAHPHVVEPFEMVTTENGKQGLVFWSVGNFISAQNEIPRTLGGMAKVSFFKIPYTDHWHISGYTMTPLVTHQEKGNYTTYRLYDYSDELASKHILRSKGLSMDKLLSTWKDILNK